MLRAGRLIATCRVMSLVINMYLPLRCMLSRLLSQYAVVFTVDSSALSSKCAVGKLDHGPITPLTFLLSSSCMSSLQLRVVWLPLMNNHTLLSWYAIPQQTGTEPADCDRRYKFLLVPHLKLLRVTQQHHHEAKLLSVAACCRQPL